MSCPLPVVLPWSFQSNHHVPTTCNKNHFLLCASDQLAFLELALTNDIITSVTLFVLSGCLVFGTLSVGIVTAMMIRYDPSIYPKWMLMRLKPFFPEGDEDCFVSYYCISYTGFPFKRTRQEEKEEEKTALQYHFTRCKKTNKKKAFCYCPFYLGKLKYNT